MRTNWIRELPEEEYNRHKQPSKYSNCFAARVWDKNLSMCFVWTNRQRDFSTGTQARQKLDLVRRKRCKFRNPPDWHRSL